MKKTPTIAILGAGEMGRAIKSIFAAQGHSVFIWDSDPKKVYGQKSLSEIIPKADFIFLCIPSWAVEGALVSVEPFLKKKAVIVSLSKGIASNGKPRSMDMLLDKILPQAQPRVILGGPMLAEEIQRNMGGAAVIASANKKIFSKISALFKNSHVSVQYESDVRGVALAGALKNVYALALGICDGLGLGANVKGMLLHQAIMEMEKIATYLGGKKETVLGVAGVSDLIATGFSPYSKNHEIGREIVQKRSCSMNSEGCATLPPLLKMLGKKSAKFTLLMCVKRAVIDRKDPQKLFMQCAKV